MSISSLIMTFRKPEKKKKREKIHRDTKVSIDVVRLTCRGAFLSYVHTAKVMRLFKPPSSAIWDRFARLFLDAS